MTTTEELSSPDGTPLGRGTMKGVVHRNAVEEVAYGRLARHIESQRRAFVRQNTRDEEEMKGFLSRLQCDQQLSALGDEEDDDDDDGSDDGDTVFSEIREEDVSLDQGQSANPYPITIMPRFQGNQRNTYGKYSSSPDSTMSRSRRTSDDYDEVQDSLSAMTVSKSQSTVGSSSASQSGSSVLSQRDELRGDWLASPDAISSVRRPRKTISEQSTRKNLIRTNSERLSQQDLALVKQFTASTKGNIRSNSMKDRRRPTLVNETNATHSRSGSLKEKRPRANSTSEGQKKLARSYSSLTRAVLTEFNQRQEKQSLSRKSSDTTDDNIVKT